MLQSPAVKVVRKPAAKQQFHFRKYVGITPILENIRIILVNTSHTGNIGSTARAMKTMGLSSLHLVDPVNEPDGQASTLAAGAGDVLANAKIVSTLEEAVKDCGLVVGASARSRTHSWPMLGPRDCGEKLVQEVENTQVW